MAFTSFSDAERAAYSTARIMANNKLPYALLSTSFCTPALVTSSHSTLA